MAEHTFGVVCATLMKAVHVELSDEGIHFAVAEVLGEHYLLELVDVLDDEFAAVGRPVDYFGELLILP